MRCPRCGSEKHYKLRGRPNVRCAGCARDFSETSATIWKYPKMSKERRAEIVAMLNAGKNAYTVSKELGGQYKTIWNIAHKLKIERKSQCLT